MKSLIAVILIQFLLVFNAIAEESIGRVVKLHGDVERARSGSESKALVKGDFLYVGDLIQSKKRSFVKILMKDDTVFQLGPKSKFSFEEFKMKTKADRKATYNLVHGKLRSLFTVKAPKRTLTIKTPTASMGIRGTEILSDVYKFRGKVKTDIALLSGKLEIMTKKKKFFLKTGYVAEFVRGKQNSIRSKTRKMSSDVFRSVKKASSRGGQIFLHDAKKKLKKINVKEVKFEALEKKESQPSKSTKSDVAVKIDKPKTITKEKIDAVKNINLNNIKVKQETPKVKVPVVPVTIKPSIPKTLVKPSSSAGSDAVKIAAMKAKEKAEKEAKEKAADKAAEKAAEEAKKSADEAKDKAAEEAKRKAQEKAKQAAEEAKKKAEEEAKEKAEEKAKEAAAEAKKKAEDKAKKEAEKKAKKAADEAKEKAKKKAEEEAKKAAKKSKEAAEKAAKEGAEKLAEKAREKAAEEAKKKAEKIKKDIEKNEKKRKEQAKKKAKEAAKKKMSKKKKNTKR